MTGGKKPIVGVVGAGIAGLATAKELKDVGVDCEVRVCVNRCCLITIPCPKQLYIQIAMV